MNSQSGVEDADGDDIYDTDHDADFDAVIPDAKPDKVEEAERLKAEREGEQNGTQETVEVPRDDFQQLVAAVEEQSQRIDELEDKLERKTTRNKIRTRQSHKAIAGTSDFDHTDDCFPLIEHIDPSTTIADVQEAVRQEQITRSREDGRLGRQIQQLAGEVDVDLEDLSSDEIDKIARLGNNGPSDVVDGRITGVHERAYDLVRNFGEWSSPTKENGRQMFEISWPDAREKLSLLRNESLQTSQVRRVFEKVEELAVNSPRSVRIEHTDSSKANRFQMELTNDELDAWTTEDQ
jgi:hypothetical protein